MRAATLLLAAALVATTTATANAGPTARLGMTFALADQGAPLQHQIGPMIGVGIPFGREDWLALGEGFDDRSASESISLTDRSDAVGPSVSTLPMATALRWR